MTGDTGTRCQICGNVIPEQAFFGDCNYCSLQIALNPFGSLSAQGGLHSLQDDVDEDPAAPQLPKDFGDYELISEIARGGMGVVYRAWQRSLNREVAIKLILAGQLASSESLERFRLEAQSAARMHHPGIVRIFEIGEFDGQQFFSMELIEGASLAECLGDFRFDLGSPHTVLRERAVTVAELVSEVARALNFAHSHGVLHRDLKPSNILIDGQGHPHLTDFGLAKLTGHADLGLTLTQAVLGTPGYLSPEQAAGNPDITTAADIYGLGAILYELLTGAPPFSGSTAVEAMWKSIHETPRQPRSFNLAIHRDLETIAMRCLEKKPEHRYSSASDVADELQRFIDRKPIVARPVSISEQLFRWSQRNPVVSSITGLLLLAIFFGTGAALWQWSRAESANAGLKQSLTILQLDAIDDRLRREQFSTALAKTAALIRTNPQDWKSAMLGISIVERSRFPLPLAPQIRHPDGAELSIARLAPDGKRVATASSDGTARIWDSMTSIESAPPLEHAGRVNWIEFSPDGRWIATGSSDQSARVWNAETGQPLCESLLHAESVTHVHFSTDGRSLLTRTRRSISVFDLTDFKVRWQQTKPTGQIVLAKFLADGDQVCSAIADKDTSVIETWDTQTGNQRLRLETGPLTLADVSDDGCVAITGTSVGGTIWNLATSSRQSDFKNPQASISKLYLDRDGRRFAMADLSGAIQVFDTDSRIPITSKLSHNYHVHGGFSKTDDQFLTWSDDSLVQIWMAGSGKRICEPIRHSFHVAYAEHGQLNQQDIYLTATSHGKQRLTDTKTGTVQLWQIHDQKAPKSRKIRIESQQDPHWGHGGAKISPDGQWIALQGQDDLLWIVEADTGERVCDPLKIDGSPWGILFTPDCRRLVVVTHLGQVSVRSLPSGEYLAEPFKIPTMMQPVEISVDGTQFATGSTDGFVRLWNVSTGRPQWESSHGSEINSVAFSPDGTLVAAAGENRVTSIWDVQTGRRIKHLVGHGNEVMSVAFSPNGRAVLTSSHDSTARVWDVVTGQEQFLLPHRGALLEASYSPDGKLIATASRDRTAMIWDAQTGQPHCRSLVSEQGVRNVRFSQDSQRLLVMNFQGLRVWDAELGIPLTVLLEQPTSIGTGFHSSTNGPQFGAKGQTAFLASDNPEAYLWDVPVPPSEIPPWFPEFLESIAGQRFIKGADIPETVAAARFLEMKAKILANDASEFYSRWARIWLGAP